MPRTRATELPQRPSPRAPTNVRTSSSSDSDPIHHRLRTERSPKLYNGRSPRSAQSDPPVNQKKLGTRIADLESQLGQAQNELKCLKDQLVSAEAAKKAAQEQLDKKSKKVKKAPPQGLISDECDVVDKETDVFEVPMVKQDETGLKNEEVRSLKEKLDEREKELEVYRQENAKMKIEVHEKSIKISSDECEVQELGMKLSKMNQELEKSKMNESQMREKLEESEKAKEGLENEMKRVRVQTEQWRKAADAAASILAGEVETNERRISERCGSTAFERGGGYGGYLGSPGLMEDCDDGKRRSGGGIRMFGDLWKKKGHK